MFLAFATSPRCPRSRKYSSVRSADNFSATATLMNWLSATPSASDTRRASSRMEACRRKATLLLLMFLKLLPRVPRLGNTNSEVPRSVGEVTHIECDQPVSRAINRRLQDHLVSRVFQPWTPQEPQMNRNRDLCQSIKHCIHLPQVH